MALVKDFVMATRTITNTSSDKHVEDKTKKKKKCYFLSHSFSKHPRSKSNEILAHLPLRNTKQHCGKSKT